jgi:hypothetical protein
MIVLKQLCLFGIAAAQLHNAARQQTLGDSSIYL